MIELGPHVEIRCDTFMTAGKFWRREQQQMLGENASATLTQNQGRWVVGMV